MRDLPFSLLLLVLASLAAEIAASPAGRGPLFTDRTAESGLDFVHQNGMTGRFYFVEVVGSGGALFDGDGDGDLDLYLVQGHMLGPGVAGDAIFPNRAGQPPGDRLYRNDLEILPDGRRKVRFTDVTEAAGLAAHSYGMGVATGDFDNDGDVDLYVTNFGGNQLWRNDGLREGVPRFRDVTGDAGVGERRWSVPAAFFDFDADGWLDLWVGNYVDFTLAGNKTCLGETGLRDYCSPESYRPLPDRLFRNRGREGGFEDVTVSSGLAAELGPTLGGVAADFDGDGGLDLYVANDQAANQLWLNQGAGEGGRVVFVNDALLLGCALDRDGAAQASMGVDAADFDGDGDQDLFMTHLTRESNTLYLNDGKGLFRDLSLESGLANPSWRSTGFGTGAFDYDNDGWLDLLVVNGAVFLILDLAREDDPYPLHQKNQLFRNLGVASGRLRFEETTHLAGAAFEPSEVSRGAVFGDVDNDGDVDVVIVNNSGPARLLINEVGAANHWLGLRVVRDGPSRPSAWRDALGARVVLRRAGKADLWRRVRTDGSYASAGDPRLLFGLGDESAVEAVEVHWPEGTVERFTGLEVDAYQTVRRGSGKVVPSP